MPCAVNTFSAVKSLSVAGSVPTKLQSLIVSPVSNDSWPIELGIVPPTPLFWLVPKYVNPVICPTEFGIVPVKSVFEHWMLESVELVHFVTRYGPPK